MKLVRIKGGLGNQLFQYSFAKLLEELTGDTIKLDFTTCYHTENDVTCEARIKNFRLSLEEATPKEIKQFCLFPHNVEFSTNRYRALLFAEKTINKKYYFEPDREYRDPNSIITNQYFDGYWQSWRYVEPVKKKISNDLVPGYDLSEKTKSFIQDVSVENSVFIGVRKGDYTTTKEGRRVFGSFSNEYYLHAMKLISDQVENPVFYIFSNDIDWCKKNMDWGNYRIKYRNPADQVSDFEELIIMSSCKHAIIINSTFHWWGAYLNDKPGKMVICPNKWFFDGRSIDIIPDYWTQIGVE